MTKSVRTGRRSKVAQAVLDGLHETLDFVKGKPTEGKLSYAYRGRFIDIREIREKMNMTCEAFAAAYHFKPKTVHNWEQGIRKPNEHTLAYLSLIASDPIGVYETLHNNGAHNATAKGCRE